ncbi:MAG TPA: hypothetical protein VLU43_10940 [Anaeromyxobacteraceae bacterium]|nr:hypothetical protein [Anaeromyxobacteraceae bacterium]
MDFIPVVERTVVVDSAGRPAEQVIEHRTDPLTGTVASLNGALGEKARAFLGGGDAEALRALEASSRAGCPFCAAEEKGTRYPPELVAQGQLRDGTSIAFPNLFSKCASDSVVVVDGARHALFPSKLAPASLASALRLAAELVRRNRARDPSLVHHLAGMNFLQPGGSSVPHPHLQVHVRSVPYSGVARLEKLSAEHRARTGRCYWTSLLAAERDAAVRHVGTTDAVEWIAAWAPSHQKEIWGIRDGVASLADLSFTDSEAFAAGIAKVAASYEEAGSHAFTLAFFSSPWPSASGHFALQARICARPAFKPLYASYDTWFGPLFAGDDAHTEAPEDYAAQLRARW